MAKMIRILTMSTRSRPKSSAEESPDHVTWNMSPHVHSFLIQTCLDPPAEEDGVGDEVADGEEETDAAPHG